jgi:hypothetical protein
VHPVRLGIQAQLIEACRVFLENLVVMGREQRFLRNLRETELFSNFEMHIYGGKMRYSGLNIKRLTATLGACLVLTLAAPIWADTDLMVDNDGLGLSALVNSTSQDVLSISIRIVGPNDFVFEDRVEGNFIDWIPDEGLPDGLYHWEAWTVTLRPDAQVRDLIAPEERGELDDDAIQHRIHNTPVERFFYSDQKDVTKKSGSFRVRGSWLEETDDRESDAMSENSQPNRLLRFVENVLDVVVPSANAEVFTDDVTIQKSAPRVFWESTTGPQSYWNFAVGGSTGDFFLKEGSTTFADATVRVSRHAPGESLTISNSGRIGFGTTAPTESLHIQENRPQIRLENSIEDQSWFVKAANAGNFEIGEMRFNSETIGSHSSFRIYPDTPEGALQVQRYQEISSTGDEGVPRGRVGINTVPTADFHVKTTQGFTLSPREASIKLESWQGQSMLIRGGANFQVGRPGMAGSGTLNVSGAAPSNSLRIQMNGNVGLGTAAPQAAFHLTRSDGTAEILLEETQASATNTMFTMRHNGNPGFRMNNTDSGAEWDFRLGGSGSTEQFTINKTSIAGPELSVLANGNVRIKGSYINGSSRELKRDISTINPADILEKLSALPLYHWSYITAPESRHIGPMAEDYYDIFKLTGEGKGLAATDVASIALAGIQAINSKAQQLEQENQSLHKRLAALEAELLSK